MQVQPAYFIFDIETVADGRLIQRVRYPDAPELSAEQAVARHREQLLAEKGSDFIPLNFQLPVSVAVCLVGEDFALQRLTSIDRPHFRPQVITRDFWTGWRRYGRPTFVTFNGRCFDLPVMELACFRYGLSLQGWMLENAKSWEDPRNRFNGSGHLDLQELLGNYGACRMHGGLDLLATVLGKPGKTDTKGYMVQDLWQAGEHLRIDDYCLRDALDTYFVFLRSRLLLGLITAERERELDAQARQVIAERVEEVPALQDYLDRCHELPAYDEEASAFLAE
ncbi:MAG: 3'-5' exonuclease [Planctomycetota bacterium]